MKKTLFCLIILLTFISQATFAGGNGDVKKGKKLAKKCAACHTLNEGGKNKIGPNLFNVVGRGIAEIEGFKYSKAFVKKKGTVVWDEETLNAFLTKPRKWEKKTKMTFPGFKKKSRRKNVISYLKTLKTDNVTNE